MKAVFCLGSARSSRAGCGGSPQRIFWNSIGVARQREGQSSRLANAFGVASTRPYAALIIGVALCLTTPVFAATLQERIDAAAPNETIRVEAGTHGSIVINKPLTLIGERGAEIRGNGVGNVVTIAA